MGHTGIWGSLKHVAGDRVVEEVGRNAIDDCRSNDGDRAAVLRRVRPHRVLVDDLHLRVVNAARGLELDDEAVLRLAVIVPCLDAALLYVVEELELALDVAGAVYVADVERDLIDPVKECTDSSGIALALVRGTHPVWITKITQPKSSPPVRLTVMSRQLSGLA